MTLAWFTLAKSMQSELPKRQCLNCVYLSFVTSGSTQAKWPQVQSGQLIYRASQPRQPPTAKRSFLFVWNNGLPNQCWNVYLTPGHSSHIVRST